MLTWRAAVRPGHISQKRFAVRGENFRENAAVPRSQIDARPRARKGEHFREPDFGQQMPWVSKYGRKLVFTALQGAEIARVQAGRSRLGMLLR